METLYKTIERHGGKQSPAILKHLQASDLTEWADLTKAGLMAFRDELKDTLSPSSAKTIGASLAAILHRYEDEGIIPCKDFATILKIKGEAPVKTYLTTDELNALERVKTKSEVEEFVLNEFIIGTKTGCRLSDILNLTEQNIENGVLTYTSIKTGITASVPCSERTRERIEWVANHPRTIATAVYNTTIRRLCKRAGIDTPVKVHKAGEDKTGPKWQFISSHSARISIATNLAIAGTNLTDIKGILGHSNTQMSERYVAIHEIKLNDKSRKLFE